MFGGSDEPCANVFFMCIGKMGPEENKAHAANLSPVIAKHLGFLKTDFIFSSGMPQLMRWHGKELLSRISLENKFVLTRAYILPALPLT